MKKVLAILLVMGMLTAGFAWADYLDSKKLNFVTELVSISNSMVDLKARADKAYANYFDNGWDSGGSNPIVAGDLTGSSYEALPVATITSGITALQEFIDYMDNAAVSQADYSATYNQLRE